MSDYDLGDRPSCAEQGTSVIADLKREHDGWTPEIAYVLDSTPASAVEQRDLYDRRARALLPPHLYGRHPPTWAPYISPSYG